MAHPQVRDVGSWAGNLMIAKYHRHFPRDLMVISTMLDATITISDGRSQHTTQVELCNGCPQAGLHLGMCQIRFLCMAVGPLYRQAKLPSSRRPSKRACLELPRHMRSQRIQTTTTQVECSCASTETVRSANLMLPLQSVPTGSAPGDLVTTSMNHLSQEAISLEMGVPEEYRKIGFFFEMESSRSFASSAVLSREAASCSCGSPPCSMASSRSSSI